MEPRTLQYIARSCAGELLSGSPDALARRVCTDSRQIEPGDLFVALAGERFDGHAFLPGVMAKPAAAVLVEKSKAPPSGRSAVIGVANTRHALGDLAAHYREEFDLPIVAVAGSNGKTTTKELIAAVLRQRFETLGSEASLNNDIGVPLTLLQLGKRHAAAVLEVGTNHPGELAPLVRMVQPRYGVLTSIGREHLEFFEDLNGVVQEEGWLAELLPAKGRLFINGDQAETERIADRTRAKVVRAGWNEANDWRALDASLDLNGTSFTVQAPDPAFRGAYRMQLLGRHQVVNALLALAVGRELGLTPKELKAGLLECPPPRRRLQIHGAQGLLVLDDCYNANADSTLAALQTLHELPGAGRRVAVLGDMAELGAHSLLAHAEVGRRAAELGLAQLLAIGRMAPVITGAARAAGLAAATDFAAVEPAIAALKASVGPGDLVLVKASRAARLERVVTALTENSGPEAIR
jgi:UDP-N-acetylmuramoyl-tripeptide--D-alanyl-D-alanine ligase